MENITKTVTFTFTKDQFVYFAKKKGWTEDSEILAEDFIVPLLMKDFVAMISSPWVLDIAEGYEEQKRQAIAQAQAELSQGISVE